MPGKPLNVTLASRGRLTLPRVIRARLCLGAGEQMTVALQADGTIVLKRQTAAAVPPLRGMLAKPARALTVSEMDAGIATAVAYKNRAVMAPARQLSR